MKDRTSGPAILTVATCCLAFTACGPSRSPRNLPEFERVEVGYGSELRRDLAGSISSLSGHELDDQRVATVEELLRGRVAGLTFSRHADGSVAVHIRGRRSLIANNEPLVVIDGLPVNAPTVSLALSGLAPQSVIRIDVLKDAGSTAAYGSRGANGVILVTTRGGSFR